MTGVVLALAALAMQEHVEDRLRSRAYSYDALGSFVAIPVGQLLYGRWAWCTGSPG